MRDVCTYWIDADLRAVERAKIKVVRISDLLCAQRVGLNEGFLRRTKGQVIETPHAPVNLHMASHICKRVALT